MKKTKLLLLPLSALLLAGCSFADAKNWFGKNVYFPVRNFIEFVINPNSGGGGNEPTPTPAPEDEKWVDIDAEAILTDYANKEDAPYTQVSLTMNQENGTDVVTDAANYAYDSEQEKWLIVGEPATGEQFGEELTQYKVTDSMINQAVENYPTSFKKSDSGKYKMSIVVEMATSVIEASWTFDQYFFIEEADQAETSEESKETTVITYSWSI